MTFEKFPKKIFINDIELLGWENAVERWRVDTKQKLEKQIEELIMLMPSTEKLEVCDFEAGESWIVETANPSQWQSFYDAFDRFVVSMKQFLQSLR